MFVNFGSKIFVPGFGSILQLYCFISALLKRSVSLSKPSFSLCFDVAIAKVFLFSLIFLKVSDNNLSDLFIGVKFLIQSSVLFFNALSKFAQVEVLLNTQYAYPLKTFSS